MAFLAGVVVGTVALAAVATARRHWRRRTARGRFALDMGARLATTDAALVVLSRDRDPDVTVGFLVANQRMDGPLRTLAQIQTLGGAAALAMARARERVLAAEGESL